MSVGGYYKLINNDKINIYNINNKIKYLKDKHHSKSLNYYLSFIFKKITKFSLNFFTETSKPKFPLFLGKNVLPL